jgi:hypothetical protein
MAFLVVLETGTFTTFPLLALDGGAFFLETAFLVFGFLPVAALRAMLVLLVIETSLQWSCQPLFTAKDQGFALVGSWNGISWTLISHSNGRLKIEFVNLTVFDTVFEP